ncbi:MAG: glycosyltransferase family 2 protein [Planctomycetota bacterium]|nr:glycosyltransferase family 2 protein [Planctomycetota bacterium]
MHLMVLAVFSTLMFVMLLNCAATAVWAWGLRRRAQKLLPDKECPKAAVVLCLRGRDPFLADCLKALLDQDYPSFDVRIIVDAVDDPAWQIAQQIVDDAQATNVRIEALAERREMCSLKCSSLIQAVNSLDDSHEFVAQIDADTIAHRSWLRELATPLADENVGATTGNRWYMPGDASWGTLVRYSWNAAAVVQMFLYNVAWGGTLAIKIKVFQQSDLLERWGHALCEDTMLFSELKKKGLRLVFVPSLMMVNRETCGLTDFYFWMRRQLLTARLYHPHWLAVAGHGILTGFATVGSALMILITLALGDFDNAALLGAGFLLYQFVMLLLWPIMESTVRRILRARHEPTEWVTAKKFANFVVTNVVMQFIYPAGLLSAMLLRKVEWRGIVYRVGRAGKIRMEADCPYQDANCGAEKKMSL